MELLWAHGQARLEREARDQLVALHLGVREGVTDVYVALGRLKRRGKPVTFADPGQPTGLEGRDLDAEVERWAFKYPGRVH